MRFSNAILGLLLATTPSIGISAMPPDFPPDRQNFERILLPAVAVNLDGQGGSQWNSDLSIRNEADAPVAIFQSYCVYFCTCVLFECEVGPPLRPHSSNDEPNNYVQIDSSEGDDRGIFLYVDRAYVDQVHFDLLLRQIGSGVRDAGTEIPIIRERDMKLGPLELLNVPLDPGVRTTLRVYGPIPDDRSLATFRIQIFEGDSSSASVDVTKAFNRTDELTFDSLPDYLVIPNIALAYPQLPVSSRLRIEITPLSPGSSYWAFASIADNVTQHVTTISPH